MSEPLVRIATFTNLQEAQIVRSYLESEGIFAHIQSEHFHGMYPLGLGAAGIPLEVKASEYERARQVLSERMPYLELIEGGRSDAPD